MALGMLLLTAASVTAGILMVQITLLPFMVRYNKAFRRKLIFSNCINYPSKVDYDHPSQYNLVNCHNFKIKYIARPSGEHVEIGVWIVFPSPKPQKSDEVSTKEFLENELRSSKLPIVLYCHGNSNHRASPERLCLYKVFQRLNFNVIAFDYRGYGDSIRIRPTEEGVVEDTFHVYSWLRSCLDEQDPPVVFLWGHSLGSAIAAHLSSELPSLCKKYGIPELQAVDALVMDAPFNNLNESVACHPYSKLVSWLPYFKKTVLDPLATSDEYSFATDVYLSTCHHLPILILHSEFDKIVPFTLALKLHSVIQLSRVAQGYDTPVLLHIFPKAMKLGHNNIYCAPNLPQVLLFFLNQIPRLQDFQLSMNTQSINMCGRRCRHCRRGKQQCTQFM